MKKIEIYVATHKDYIFPDIEIYRPIHVGKALSDLELNIQTDNSGENISYLNKNFCELTALYWMWKNSDAEVLGLVHYRRYFSGSAALLQEHKIFNVADYQEKQGVNVIVAKKVTFLKSIEKFWKFNKKNYFSNYEQFCLNHFSKDWDELGKTINTLYPEYVKSFEHISNSKMGLSLYNMFIADRAFVDGYCEWLFTILFALKEKINIDDYDTYQARLYGFLSERLLNVYIYHHRKEINLSYQDVLMLE
ncbi:DUF4422 domain-containing protein [Acinetobacter shaoyimingii]|uniref:DUF4422 domain-containing protein n=1 Tax=Acinetobacter shaoyimingii TaxID=2715164 RepID=A0A6G8RY40_9GAMM|nr:DUF4422 domain-containing protein [Acinetobacter shaoyimingii]QIO06849.1 DUF4422 domain-containing protein [Acinetobacter shaoyimingii]